MLDLGLLKVDGVIFHHIPQRSWDAEEAAASGPILSDKEQSVGSRLEFYLRDQVTKTFLQSSQAVKADPDLTSILPTAIQGLLHANPGGEGFVDSFIELTKTAAGLLFEEQHPNAPSGLMVFLRGSLGARSVLCVAKLEQQSGLSFDVVEVDGVQTVTVALEDGLVLTEKTEVFKAAVFALDDSTSDELEGLVSDEQSGNLYRAPITDYWLRGFLGCKYANESAVQTRAFIKAVTTAINQDIEDIEVRDKAFDALAVELASNRRTISPKSWIKDHIDSEDQDRVLGRLREAGVWASSFPKSSEVADHAPKFKWYEFSDGRKVKVPADRTVELETFGEESNKEDVLTIRGKIVRIR